MKEIPKKYYQDALTVQDASNLSGVVHSFSEVMTAMSEAGLDSRQKEEHPITTLFVTQIVHLTGHDGGFMKYCDASEACKKEVE